MSRVAPPVFVHIETHSSDPSLQNSSRQILHEVAHDTMVMALIDEELIIWLPGLNAECVDSIRWQLSLRQGGLDLGSAQIVNDRTPPPILRRAAKSGRAFCVWSDRSQQADAWRTLGISPPSRWIELLDLARAGGWPEDFSALMWNVLSIRPPQGLLPQYQVSHPQAHSSPIEYWTTRIRAAGNQLLGVADLYDPLRQHDEPDLLETHHAINKRGIRLDVELARDVLCLAREYAESQFSTIAATTQGTMSTSQLLDDRYVLSWLQSWGIPLTRLDAKSIRGLLNETRSQNVRFSASAESVLHARLTLAEQPIGSLWRALELVNPRQRICGHMEYYSSRSGEFSSPGIAFGQLMTMAYFSNSPWRTSYYRFPCLDQVRSRLPRGSSVDDILASMVTDCLIPADDHLFTVCRWRFLSKAILRWLVSHHSQREHHSGLTQSEDCRQLLVEQLRDALAHEQHAEFCHCQLEISSDAIQVRLPSGRSIFFRNIRAFDVDDFPRGGDGQLTQDLLHLRQQVRERIGQYQRSLFEGGSQ